MFKRIPSMAVGILIALTLHFAAEAQPKPPKIVSSHSSSTSSCNGNNILLYNMNNGSGQMIELRADGYTTTKTFSAGSLPVGSTIVAPVDLGSGIIFYSGTTGKAVLGTIRRAAFNQSRSLDGFALNWTSILYAGLMIGKDSNGFPLIPLALFYNLENGSAAVGFAPTKRQFSLGPGLTHIVWDGQAVLIYDNIHGYARVGIPLLSDPSTRTYDALEFHGKLTPGVGFTHLAVIGSEILFYNSADGSAMFGGTDFDKNADNTNFVTIHTYPAKAFAPNWTHIVGAAPNLAFFYNATSGEAAIGEIPAGKFSPTKRHEFTTTKTFAPNTFPTGITNIVCGQE